MRFSKLNTKEQSSWKMTDIASKEPYIDGFEVTGNFSRKREKSKEVDSEFCITFAKDTWNKNFPRPISNSTYFSAMKTRPLVNSSKIYPNSFIASRNSILR